MRILIIDNNIDPDCWGSADLCRLAREVPDSSIYVRRAPQGDLPKSPQGFDFVIVSGSKTSALEETPWVHQLFEFIRRTVNEKIPFLGVCYGHQALIRALGSREYVRKAETAEFGWAEIEVLEESSLLKGLPKTFYSFSTHFDEASQLPTGMTRLAQSKNCFIQACQLNQLPIFGIQFHPEKTLEEAKKILFEKKKKGIPAQLLNPTQSDELYDPKVGELIFKNFFNLKSL